MNRYHMMYDPICMMLSKPSESSMSCPNIAYPHVILKKNIYFYAARLILVNLINYNPKLIIRQ